MGLRFGFRVPAFGDRDGRGPGGDDSVMADVDDARVRRPTRSPSHVIRDCWGIVAVYGGDDSVMADVDEARARRPTRSPSHVIRDCWGMVAVYGGDDSVMADVDEARVRRPTRSPSQCDSGLVGGWSRFTGEMIP